MITFDTENGGDQVSTALIPFVMGTAVVPFVVSTAIVPFVFGSALVPFSPMDELLRPAVDATPKQCWEATAAVCSDISTYTVFYCSAKLGG